MQTSQIADALRVAWFRRRPERGLIFYPERGRQYRSHAIQQTLVKYGMGFGTRHYAIGEVIGWLMFYHHKKLHPTPGYISPMQFEKNWSAAQLKDAAYWPC